MKIKKEKEPKESKLSTTVQEYIQNGSYALFSPVGMTGKFAIDYSEEVENYCRIRDLPCIKASGYWYGSNFKEYLVQIDNERTARDILYRYRIKEIFVKINDNMKIMNVDKPDVKVEKITIDDNLKENYNELNNIKFTFEWPLKGKQITEIETEYLQ